MKHETREGWLTAAVDELREHFRTLKLVVPAKVRVACGWPGAGSSRKLGGECWETRYSASRHTEIFISPLIADPTVVLAILTHELVHAAIGVRHGHDDKFKQAARIVGLEGKLSATYAGTHLSAVLYEIAEDLGPYLHTPVTFPARKPKKSTPRMLKASCLHCGYIVRVSRRWLDEGGPPICPTCRVVFEEEKK